MMCRSPFCGTIGAEGRRGGRGGEVEAQGRGGEAYELCLSAEEELHTNEEVTV